MNNLNSVLVEGEISRSCEYDSDSRNLSFEIESKRYYRNEAGLNEKINTFTIEVSGKLAETAFPQIVSGRGVRVVGRLESENNGFIKVIAEHIEFRSSTSTPTEGKMRKEKKHG
jgi:single-stranded DNA-binding protein